jgi:hypothetical protein
VFADRERHRAAGFPNLGRQLYPGGRGADDENTAVWE